MTYGADFRPGAHSLPRHDTVKLPPIAAHAAHVAAGHYMAKSRHYSTLLTPERLRRVVAMCNNGESLPEACRRLGLNAQTMRKHLATMPIDLLGPVLAKRREAA